jgi:tRNA (mo5U34)-methyltransferase
VASDLARRVHELPWHHQIDFGNGLLSPGNTKISTLKAQADVYFRHCIDGKDFLDIGCWDGFNSFESRRRGAARVLATDHFAWSKAHPVVPGSSTYRGDGRNLKRGWVSSFRVP